jgi:DNA sulfur modification protein DndD
MRFLTLSVHNFGVFRGRHDFDLAPVPQPGNTLRHLTVISGHNGAGKSTLFQALALALHGPLALGDRVSQRAYSDYLLSRLHRRSGDKAPVFSEIGSITLDFEYVMSGRLLHIQAKRKWQRNESSVEETLDVFQDGQRLDVPQADYQIWLNGLIPPGLAPLCFFDAEQLNTLAEPEQHSQVLGEILHRLLGLDLVARLQSDLDYYTRKHGGTRRVERIQTKVLEHQAAVDKLKTQLAEVDAKAENAEQVELETELNRQENQLAAEGGSYAARRKFLQERRSTIQEEIQELASELRDLSAGLLPFALAPELCQALSRRLEQEAETHHLQIAERTWQERVARFEAALHSEEPWQDMDVSPSKRPALARRLVGMLRERETPYDFKQRALVHHLSEPERVEIQGWINQVLNVVPQQVQILGERMRDLQAEREKIEADLSRAPDDEILAPIHDTIMRLETALSDLRERRSTLEKQKGALQFQYEEAARQRQRASEQLENAQAGERQLELAQRSKLALEAYRDALIQQRMAGLENRLVAAFNAICRKEHLLAAVRIAPDDFQVYLESADGHKLELDDFSAGERQLYAMALLWALRQASGRQLPLAVDTPLARLDEVHRYRLVHDYVPAVSKQVVLLATEAELDDGLLTQAEPYLVRIYHLNYDPQQEQTLVTHEERENCDA